MHMGKPAHTAVTPLPLGPRWERFAGNVPIDEGRIRRQHMGGSPVENNPSHEHRLHKLLPDVRSPRN